MQVRFLDEQPVLNWQPINGGLVDVTICLNGREVTEEDSETGAEISCWEYDFHQFREKLKNISKEKVESNPCKYLTYQPIQEKTLEQLVKDQQEEITMLKECLLEMSEDVYA